MLCRIGDTDSWIEVSIKEIKATSNESAFSVSRPDEVKAYVRGKRLENTKQDFNTSALLAGLVIVGAVASGSGSSDLATAGAATAVAAGAVSVGKEVGKDYERSQFGEPPSYGGEHLLGGGFKIPPNMFDRRSIL